MGRRLSLGGRLTSRFGLARLALEILLRLVGEIVRADVAGRARMIDHVRIRIDLDRLEEGGQADAVDRLADALVLEGVLGEEVDQSCGRTRPASRSPRRFRAS